MTLPIASVSVLKGKAADRFDDLMVISENRRGHIDFTRQIAVTKKILEKVEFKILNYGKEKDYRDIIIR